MSARDALKRYEVEINKCVQEETYWLTDIEWITEFETAAVCNWTFHCEEIINGQPVESLGCGTSFFRKESDSWKITFTNTLVSFQENLYSDFI